jgi:hypothetical protein
MIIEERTLITVGWDRMMYSLDGDLEGYQPLWRSAVLCGNRVSGMMMRFDCCRLNWMGAWKCDVDHLNLLHRRVRTYAFLVIFDRKSITLWLALRCGTVLTK